MFFCIKTTKKAKMACISEQIRSINEEIIINIYLNYCIGERFPRNFSMYNVSQTVTTPELRRK